LVSRSFSGRLFGAAGLIVLDDLSMRVTVKVFLKNQILKEQRRQDCARRQLPSL
jgi:hypothetical protein